MLHRAASGSIFSTADNIMQHQNQKLLHSQQTIGERLRWLRESNRKSLEAFGAEIGYDKSYLSRLESGQSGNPSAKFLDALCSKHLVSREWLLSGSGEPFQWGVIANATEPAEVDSLESGWEQVFSQLPAGSKPVMESMVKTFCLVEGVRLLLREMPADQRLQKYQEVVESPSITPAAQVFWLLVLTKAMIGRWPKSEHLPIAAKRALSGSIPLSSPSPSRQKRPQAARKDRC